MKYMTKRLKISILVCLIVIVISLSLHIPVRTALVFYKENTHHIEAYLPLHIGDTFQIVFTHSIHLTDVVEKYKVSDDHQISQYEMIFEQFGIGMPSNAEGEETLVYDDGKYYLKNINRIFPSLNIRNGKTVSKHRLRWGEQDQYMAWFNTYFEPGAWFTLKIEKLSLWQLMKGEKIHG